MSRISTFLGAFRDIVYVERFAASNGWLQEVDVRVKLACATGMIASAVAVSTLMPLTILFGFIIVLCVVSSIPLRFFLTRVAFVPVFAVIIALPIPFMTPGTTLMQVELGGFAVSVSSEGVHRAVLFALRVLVCVASLVLLMLTTKSSKLFRALQDLRLPTILVAMTSVTYRFIFLFIDEARRMMLAKESRTVNRQKWREELRSLAHMMATLFVRAYERGERVYLAMLARGYSRLQGSTDTTGVARVDMLFGGLSVSVCFAALLVEHLRG